MMAYFVWPFLNRTYAEKHYLQENFLLYNWKAYCVDAENAYLTKINIFKTVIKKANFMETTGATPNVTLPWDFQGTRILWFYRIFCKP
jgi:hypothetical protein